MTDEIDHPKDPSTQNRAAYDQIASRFAERNAEMLPYVIDEAHRVLSLTAERHNSTLPILDLGCGTGRDMAYFEAHGANMVGADLSLGMLSVAKVIVKGPLAQLDMRFLPFKHGCFTAVWCQAALLHLPKAQAPAALEEIRRVLAPHGVVHIAVQKGNTEGYESRPYEPVERYYAHYQADEMTGILQSSGFTIIAAGEAEARRSWIWVCAGKA